MIHLKWLILFISLSCVEQIQSQHIEILNSSFEGQPADATVPQGWMACKEGTTPDILPGYWGVYSDPSDGDTYMGLITRLNNTWESVGQRLPAALEKDNCYTMSMDLAHSDTYSGYSGPIKLRVWISKLKCQKDQLIFESPLIDHDEWKTYKLKFSPDHQCRYILLEAFYSDQEFSFQGNILIDRLSPIQGCDRS